jgi:hypothetical protein
MSNETKVTAVEWYKSEVLNLHIDLESKQITLGEFAVKYVEKFEQAQALEKQQIIDAHDNGHNYYEAGGVDAEQYYTETYGN